MFIYSYVEAPPGHHEEGWDGPDVGGHAAAAPVRPGGDVVSLSYKYVG